MGDAILKDEKITLIDKNDEEFQPRRIAYWHEEKRKVYELITNNYKMEVDKVASIYENHWQIETISEMLKQKFPLKY